LDHLTTLKIRFGVTEPDDAKARAMLLSILVQNWLDLRATNQTQQAEPAPSIAQKAA
jgi:hypothetical protein